MQVEDKRHALEKKLIGIQLRYTTMQKQLNHKNQQVHRLKVCSLFIRVHFDRVLVHLST